MMRKEEVFRQEQHVTDSIIFHYEGMFWKAYERSAFLFCTYVKDFTPVKERIKYMDGQEMIYIGVKDDTIDVHMSPYTLLEETPTTRTYGMFPPLREEDFLQWKKGIRNRHTARPAPVLPDLQVQAVYPSVEPKVTVESRIRDFDIVNSTPFDCMKFVMELKKAVAQ